MKNEKSITWELVMKDKKDSLLFNMIIDRIADGKKQTHRISVSY